MNLVDIYVPPTVPEALDLLRSLEGRALVIAGGTDLVPRLRARESRAAALIDIGRLPFAGLRRAGDRLILGARMTHSALASAPEVTSLFPALACACQSIGGRPIRNRGTIGGNLANASPAADTAPPLLAYDAELRLVHSGGERIVPLREFFTGPGATILRGDELIAEVVLPNPPPGTGAAFLKLGRRKAMAIAVVSVAARLTFDAAGRIAEVRLALGSVAPSPLRASEAEAILLGTTLDEERIRWAATAARRSASPISDLRASASYRSRMVEVLTRRALHLAWKGSRG